MDLQPFMKQCEAGILWPLFLSLGEEDFLRDMVREKVFKAAGCDAQEIVEFDDAHELRECLESPSLFFRKRLIIVRDAQSLQNIHVVTDVPDCICIFEATNCDQRKKVYKYFAEKGRIVQYEAPPEKKRAAWVQYFAKKHGTSISVDESAQLQSADPFSLYGLSLEIAKRSLCDQDVSLLPQGGSPRAYFEAFFLRDHVTALRQVGALAQDTQGTIMMLGLMNWHIASLLHMHDGPSMHRTSFARGFLARIFPLWKPDELGALIQDLFEIDVAIKLGQGHAYAQFTLLAGRYSSGSG